MTANRITADHAQAEASSGFVACPVVLLAGFSEARQIEIQQMYELALEYAVTRLATSPAGPWHYPIGFSAN